MRFNLYQSELDLINKWYYQLNLHYSDFLEYSGSSKLRINTLPVYF